MSNQPRKAGGEITSVIFLGTDGAFLPNGRDAHDAEFERVILASTNYPKSVCDRLADDIRNGEVAFPFYLNVTRKAPK